GWAFHCRDARSRPRFPLLAESRRIVQNPRPGGGNLCPERQSGAYGRLDGDGAGDGAVGTGAAGAGADASGWLVGDGPGLGRLVAPTVGEGPGAAPERAREDALAGLAAGGALTMDS